MQASPKPVVGFNLEAISKTAEQNRNETAELINAAIAANGGNVENPAA